jgi:short-subunit dehydrogenase
VILVARTTSQLQETRALLGEHGVPAGRVSVFPADLANEEDRGRALAEALAATGATWDVSAAPAGA